MDINFVIGCLFVIAVIYVLLKRGRKSPAPGSIFRQRDTLFTAAERSFLGVLDQATAGRYRVFGKVRVADVLDPAPKDRSARTVLFNQIKAKHFDFVLCDPGTLDVKAVVELNDKSHRSKRRAERDQFLRMACNNAGLPLLEVEAKRAYAVESVRHLLAEFEAELQGTQDNARLEPTLL